MVRSTSLFENNIFFALDLDTILSSVEYNLTC